MKKLLFNKKRTKIFNLDQVVMIEKIVVENSTAFLLYFGARLHEDMCFGVFSSEKICEKYLSCFEKMKDSTEEVSSILQKQNLWKSIVNGNFDCNEKLFQFFDRKFSRFGHNEKHIPNEEKDVDISGMF